MSREIKPCKSAHKWQPYEISHYYNYTGDGSPKYNDFSKTVSLICSECMEIKRLLPNHPTGE